MKLNSQQSFIGGVLAMIVATSCCGLPAVIIGLGGASSVLAFSERLEDFSGVFMAIGLAFLGWGFYTYFQKNKSSSPMEAIVPDSLITCPNCGYQKKEIMPTDACQYFYECENCKTILKPQQGDCCVFCSYGTVACPPIQLDQNCC